MKLAFRLLKLLFVGAVFYAAATVFVGVSYAALGLGVAAYRSVQEANGCHEVADTGRMNDGRYVVRFYGDRTYTAVSEASYNRARAGRRVCLDQPT